MLLGAGVFRRTSFLRAARCVLMIAAVLAVVASRARANDWEDLRPKDARFSVTFSPYHLAFPMFLASAEMRVRLHYDFGAALDLGAGGYRGASVNVFGVRLPLYIPSFSAAVQVGPFVRATWMRYASSRSLSPPPESSAHNLGAPIYNELEFARSNGRSAVYPGVLVGGKYIGPFGITGQVGFLIGYVLMIGRSKYGIDPYAWAHGSTGLATLYFDIGWSF